MRNTEIISMSNCKCNLNTPSEIIAFNKNYSTAFATAMYTIKSIPTNIYHMNSGEKEEIAATAALKACLAFDPNRQKASISELARTVAKHCLYDYCKMLLKEEGGKMSLDTLMYKYSSDDEQNDPEEMDDEKDFLKDLLDEEYDEDICNNLTVESIRSALATLSENDQIVLRMLEEKWARDKMAEVLRCSRNTLDKRIHDVRVRARKALSGFAVRLS